MRFFALPVAVLASLVFGADADTKCSGPDAVNSPPPGAIVVDANRKYPNSFASISQAVATLTGTTSSSYIFIYPGNYKEQVLIETVKGPLVLQGFTCNTTSYADNQVTITHSEEQRDLSSNIPGERNDLIATLRVKTDNVHVYNLNVENTAARLPQGGQAVALHAAGDKCGFYACSFSAYQDTVYAHHGRQVYAKSHISGEVDFIFGSASALFVSCDIETVGDGAITANGRISASDLAYYLIDKSRLYGKSGAQKSFLGRPWGKFSRVVVQNSYLGDVINSQGWEEWNGDTDTANIYFKECNNNGPGASLAKRVPFSGKLDVCVARSTVLGNDYESYVDKRFL